MAKKVKLAKDASFNLRRRTDGYLLGRTAYKTENRLSRFLSPACLNGESWTG